ncbi:hypothetical protein B0H34DRAFT_710942 [Crassisporium funariophilum]|nr:hypothetical protein B0H34DRAFT_710942 [Crassisporium funariophilum]
MLYTRCTHEELKTRLFEGALSHTSTTLRLSAPELWDLFPQSPVTDNLDFDESHENLIAFLNLPYPTISAYELRHSREIPSTEDATYRLPLLISPRSNYVTAFVMGDLRSKAKSIPNRSSDLQIVLDLPMELIFEIFERLHPVDLYNFVRTTKGLRQMLLSRKAESIWSESFLRHPDIPACPADVSFPEWTSLLFGPNKCDDCSEAAAMPEFACRTRLCTTCLGNRFFHATHFPSILAERLSMGRYTYRHDGMVYPTEIEYTYDPMYLEEDVEDMIQVYSFILHTTVGTPNAAEDVLENTTKVIAVALNKVEHAKLCERWCRDAYDKLHIQHQMLIPGQVKRCQRRLAHLDLDLEWKDIKASQEEIEQVLEETRITHLTSKAFRYLLPDLHSAVKVTKNSRLAAERQQLIDARRGAINDYYDNACQQYLKPDTWPYLPAKERLYDLDCISKYITSDSLELGEMPVELANEDFIRQYTDTWMVDGKERVLSTLSAAEENRLDKTRLDLDLATAVFVCSSNSCYESSGTALFGWKDAGLHLNCIYDMYYQPHLGHGHELGPRFSAEGHRAVVFVLELLGLDPASTAANDPLLSRARFICTACVMWKEAGVRKGRHALTWKESVSHFMKMCDRAHESPSFAVLTEEATKIVLFHEDPYPPPSDRSWSCKLCPQHWKDRVKRAEVVAHVQDEHSIRYPVTDVDFFYFPKTTGRPIGNRTSLDLIITDA